MPHLLEEWVTYSVEVHFFDINGRRSINRIHELLASVFETDVESVRAWSKRGEIKADSDGVSASTQRDFGATKVACDRENAFPSGTINSDT